MRKEKQSKSFLMKPRRGCCSGRYVEVENIIYFISESTRPFAVTSMNSIYWHLIPFVSKTSHIINVTLQGNPPPIPFNNQTNNMSQHRRHIFQSHILHPLDEFDLYCRASRRGVCAQANFSSCTQGPFFWNIGTRLGSLNQPASQPASSLLCLQRPCQPAVDPFTFRRPVAFRHPLQHPLKWCLLQCTVGVNHTPRECRVEFHTMGPPASVVWGFRGRIRD